MRTTSPITLLLLLTLSLVAAHPALAHPRHATGTAVVRGKTKTAHAGTAHAAAHAGLHSHGVAATHAAAARGRQNGSAYPASRVSLHLADRAGARGQRHVRKIMLHPGSRAAVRAHQRIHADLARRRSHGHLAPLPAQLQPVRLVIPAPLRGSHESLVRQNVMAEADGLERILDDDDLQDRITQGSLVPVPVSASLHINTDLPENRRYTRPWTAKFLTDLAAAHTKKFSGTAIEVTSAVRTVEYQRRLRHTNGNAAAADGDIASPHLTGGTIDIAKQGMSPKEVGWLRGWLIPLEQSGKIDVEEEFRQSCFHISVYKNYTAPKGTPKDASPAATPSMLAIHGR